jgi:hypothetical protein
MPVIGWVLDLGFHSRGVEDLSLVGCYMVSLVEWLQHVKRTVVPSSSGLSSPRISIYHSSPKDFESFTLKHVSLAASICTPKRPSVT